MQAENAKHAAEMLKRSGELAGTAAEMLEGGAVGEAVTQLLEQAKTLPAVRWSCWGSTLRRRRPASPRLRARRRGAAILTGTALYLVPEWRRTVEDAVKVVVDTLRDVK